MFEVTISLPATITVPLGDTGKSTEVAIQSIARNPDVLRFALLNGFMGALNNISRGKDEASGKPNSDDVWAAARAKKVDTWLAGEWAARASGGERQSSMIREAYVDFVKRETKATQGQVDASIKALVVEMFGKDESATFARFMDAWALKRARKDGDDSEQNIATVREAFESKFRKMAEAAAASRAKAASKLDLSDLDI
jgi:hypothetical protein